MEKIKEGLQNFWNKCKTTRLLATIGIIAMILGVILPYFKIDLLFTSTTLSLWNYWEGKVIAVLILANILFIYRDMVEKYVPTLFNSTLGKKIKECNNGKIALLPTIISAVLAIYLLFTLGIELFKSYSIGFYVLWIGIICLCIYSFLHIKDNFTENIKM